LVHLFFALDTRLFASFEFACEGQLFGPAYRRSGYRYERHYKCGCAVTSFLFAFSLTCDGCPGVRFN
jgi:hypothetical protein